MQMMSHLFSFQGADEAKVRSPALTVRNSSPSNIPRKITKNVCHIFLSFVLSFSLEKSINLFTSFKTVTIKGHCRLFDKSAMRIDTVLIVVDIHNFINLNFL
jgi:hypothetical protein